MQRPVSVEIIFSVWNVLVRDTIFSFSLTEKLRYNSSFELAGAQGRKKKNPHVCYMNLNWAELESLQKDEQCSDDAEEKFLLSNLAGHTNDIW